LADAYLVHSSSSSHLSQLNLNPPTLLTHIQKADDDAWCNLSHAALYVYAARAIRIAYDRQLLTDADLWSYDDDEFWSRLVHSPDPDVKRAASKVRGDLRARPLPLGGGGGEGEEQETAARVAIGGGDVEEILEINAKIRTIDPDIVVDPKAGTTKRLSELDPEYRQRLVKHVARKKGARRIVVFYDSSIDI
jgi:hypothetical protein